jgi:hypothetical protein
LQLAECRQACREAIYGLAVMPERVMSLAEPEQVARW